MRNDEEGEGIKNPHDHDVLCGRGGASFKHVGNYTFRYLVQLNKPMYVTCKKSQKRSISINIVTAIRNQNPPGRFVELNSKDGFWHEISETKTIEKTSQALREGQAVALQKMQKKQQSSPENTFTPTTLSSQLHQQQVSVSNVPSNITLEQHDNDHAYDTESPTTVTRSNLDMNSQEFNDTNLRNFNNISNNSRLVQQQQSLNQRITHSLVSADSVYDVILNETQQQQEPVVISSNYTPVSGAVPELCSSNNINTTAGIVNDYQLNSQQQQSHYIQTDAEYIVPSAPIPNNVTNHINNNDSSPQQVINTFEITKSNNNNIAPIPDLDGRVNLTKRHSLAASLFSMGHSGQSLYSNIDEDFDEDLPNDLQEVWEQDIIYSEPVNDDAVPIINEDTMFRARRLSSLISRTNNKQEEEDHLSREEEDHIIRTCSILSDPLYSILPSHGKKSSVNFGMRGSAVSILSEFSSMSICSRYSVAARKSQTRIGGDLSSKRFSQMSLLDDDMFDNKNDNDGGNHVISWDMGDNKKPVAQTDARSIYVSKFLNKSSVFGKGNNKRNGMVVPESIQDDVAKLMEQDD